MLRGLPHHRIQYGLLFEEDFDGRLMVIWLKSEKGDNVLRKFSEEIDFETESKLCLNEFSIRRKK